MTRDDAIAMVQAYFKSLGLESAGLNEQNLGGAIIGDAQIYFEYEPVALALKCSVLIYKFQVEPKSGIVEKFKEEELSTDTGGGKLEYEPESRGLYLSRTYVEPVSQERLFEDLAVLIKASEVWSDEVLDRIASKVFHPEELSAAN